MSGPKSENRGHVGQPIFSARDGPVVAAADSARKPDTSAPASSVPPERPDMRANQDRSEALDCLVSLADDVLAVSELLKRQLDGGVLVRWWAGDPELNRRRVERDYLSAKAVKPISVYRRVLESKGVVVPASKGHGRRNLPALQNWYEGNEEVVDLPIRPDPNPTACPKFIIFGLVCAWREFAGRLRPQGNSGPVAPGQASVLLLVGAEFGGEPTCHLDRARPLDCVLHPCAPSHIFE